MRMHLMLMPLLTLNFLAFRQINATDDGSFALHRAMQSSQITPTTISSEVSFDDATGQLAKQGHICLIGEPMPYQSIAKGADATALQTLLHDTKISLHDKVRGVAKVFDYRAVESDSHIFLLYKAYSHEDDLPDTTFDEIKTGFQNFAIATSDCPRLSGGQSLGNFYRLLSAEQKDKVREGITVGELSDAQKRTISLFFTSFDFRALNRFSGLATELQGYNGARPQFGWAEPFGSPYPVYSMMTDTAHLTDTIVLGYWVQSPLGGGYGFEGVADSVELVNNKIVAKEIDPTTPGPEPTRIASEALLAGVQKSVVPLSDVVKVLNPRLTAENPAQIPVTVDENAARKRTLFVGAENTTASAALNVVVALHNYRLVKTSDNSRVIRLQNPHKVVEISDLYTEVRRLLPASYWRAVENATYREYNALNTKPLPVPDSGPNGIPSDFLQRLQEPKTKYQATVDMRKALYITCVRRLREIIEPLLAKSETKTLKMREAPDEARDLAALSRLIVATEELLHLPKETPLYITHFDEAKIKVSPMTFARPGARTGKLDYELSCQSPDGQRTDGVAGSITGVRP